MYLLLSSDSPLMVENNSTRSVNNRITDHTKPLILLRNSSLTTPLRNTLTVVTPCSIFVCTLPAHHLIPLHFPSIAQTCAVTQWADPAGVPASTFAITQFWAKTLTHLGPPAKKTLEQDRRSVRQSHSPLCLQYKKTKRWSFKNCTPLFTAAFYRIIN